jgi:predicted transcriptional regulator
LNAIFNLRIPDELNDKIAKIADEYGVSKNLLITMACEDFIKSGKLEDIEKRLVLVEKELARLKKETGSSD